MTCNECIHHSRCKKIHNPNNEYNFMMYYGTAHAELECEDFKDKSRFVELPCTIGIGTTVYEIVPKCDASEHCPFNGGYGYDRCSGTQFSGRYGLCKAYIHETKFSFCDKDRIGKDVFLTREEAEKSLEKERGK